MNRVTYVVNGASRTGAPKSALHVLDHIDRSRSEITVVLLRSGPLLPDFERLADRTVVEPHGWSYVWVSRVRFRGVSIAWAPELAAARRWLDRLQPDTVIADTVVSGAWVAESARRGLVTGLIVRENEPSLGCFLRSTGLAEALPTITSIAVNSAATGTQLGKYMDGPATRLLPPSVDWDDIQKVRRAADERAPVVVACGSVTYVKGADVFPAIIGLANQQHSQPVKGRWIGDGPLRRRLSRTTRGTDTTYVGPKGSAIPELAAAQVCVIPSRAEPLSRVALEACALGTPVVAFDVGGLRESLGPGGVIVPNGDIEAMARHVVELLSDESLRTAVGERGRQHVLQAFGKEATNSAARSFLAELAVPARR